jgi:hypothetical protein
VIRLNNKVRRVIAGLVLLVFLTCAANYYFEFHMLERFDKAALSLCLIHTPFFRHAFPQAGHARAAPDILLGAVCLYRSHGYWRYCLGGVA